MCDRLPLHALLSQVLVAFTIEFDNEFEHQVPHRTTNHGSTARSGSVPWLVSMVMWLKFMRFVPVDGITVRDLQRCARLTGKEMRTWLTRMSQWWGYVVIDKDAAEGASSRPSSGWVVRPTPGGRKALESWRPLTGVIENRWRERFGCGLIDPLRESLRVLVSKLDAVVPDCLPILEYDLLSKCPDHGPRTPAETCGSGSSEDTLPVLLSKLLLAFAIEFERESGLSLAISANVLRLIGPEGVRVRDLPHVSGVSKEAIALSLGRLEQRGLAVVQPESPGSRTKILVLTPKGRSAQDACRQLVCAIEERWEARLGKSPLRRLRGILERLAGAPTEQQQRPPLFLALEPYPDGWRASLPIPGALPHYPMVLHRGGFPDGS